MLIRRRQSILKPFDTRDTEVETRHAVSSIEIKAVSETGEIEGYGSVFENEDSYGDTVAKGAFLESLSEHKAAGTMPAMLYQHRSDEPIGVWDHMEEDSTGLLCRGKLLMDTQKGKDVHAMLTAKAIRGLSIGFIAKKWENTDEDDYWTRRVIQIDLWEVSVVTFPANRAATVTDVKNRPKIETIRDLERYLRDVGCSKSEAAAAIAAVKRDVARRDSEGEARQIQNSLNGFLQHIQESI